MRMIGNMGDMVRAHMDGLNRMSLQAWESAREMADAEPVPVELFPTEAENLAANKMKELICHSLDRVIERLSKPRDS